MHKRYRVAVGVLVFLIFSGKLDAQRLVPSAPSGELEQYYQRVWFAPSGTGYVASQDALLRTRDGGMTWAAIRESFRGDKPGIRKLFFVNESTFFVFGWAGFWRTTDGGATFERFARVVPAIDDPNDHDELREGFFFLDADRGWAFGDGQLLITKDGGKTWLQRRLRKRDLGPRQPSQLWMFDAQHAIAVGAEQVFRTEDEGLHWVAAPNSPRLDEVQCTASGYCAGRMLGGVAVLHVSHDAGNSWQSLPTGMDPDRDRILASQVLAVDSVMLAGTHNDQGRSERLAHGPQAVKPTAAPSRGLLLRWNGNTWDRREFPQVSELQAIHFVSATEAWASADFNGIIHSTDGGQSWTFVPDYYRQAAARTPAPTPLYIMATPPPTP